MQIFVQQLEFVGPHGVYEEERREGRRFSVDLMVEVSGDSGAETDDLVDTLDYRGLAEIVLGVGKGPSCHLIEHMAQGIVEQVLARFAQVRWAEVTIRKYATGVPGDPECVGVRLRRDRPNV